jgi:hypothetical protein
VGMIQGKFIMASWARCFFQFSDRNNDVKKWIILQITQFVYLQTNVLMFPWRRFVFDVKFRLDCTTDALMAFSFKLFGCRGRYQMTALMHTTWQSVVKGYRC